MFLVRRLKFDSSEESYQENDDDEADEADEAYEGEEEVIKAPSIPSEKPEEEEKKEPVPEKTFQRKNRKLVLDSEDEEDLPKRDLNQDSEASKGIPEEKKPEARPELMEEIKVNPPTQIEETKENLPPQMEAIQHENSNSSQVALRRTLSRDIVGRRSRQLAINSATNAQSTMRLTRNRPMQQMETEEVIEDIMCTRCG